MPGEILSQAFILIPLLQKIYEIIHFGQSLRRKMFHFLHDMMNLGLHVCVLSDIGDYAKLYLLPRLY